MYPRKSNLRYLFHQLHVFYMLFHHFILCNDKLDCLDLDHKECALKDNLIH